VYGGDPAHNLSQSLTVNQVVQWGSTSTSVTSSLNPSAQGQSVTFTATVSPVGLTGTVTFRSNGIDLGTSTMSNGAATFGSSTLPVGSNSITASYNGNTRYLSNSSPPFIQIVKASTTTTLGTSPNPSITGAAVTLTASVSPSAATGTVQFYNGAIAIGSLPLSGGQAQLVVSNLPAGTNSLQAVYAGDSSNAGSSSAQLAQVVKTLTTLTLTNSPNPSTFGSAVTLTASVAPATATGSVQFFNGGMLLGSTNLTNGKASLTITYLPAGTNSLSANYGGDAGNAPSTSNASFQTVSKANSTTRLSANPTSQSNSGQSVIFTATVAPSSATGVVQFLDGPSLIGTATLNNGIAVFSTFSLSVGNHSIKASYGGDGNVNGSQSAALSFKVKH